MKLLLKKLKRSKGKTQSLNFHLFTRSLCRCIYMYSFTLKNKIFKSLFIQNICSEEFSTQNVIRNNFDNSKPRADDIHLSVCVGGGVYIINTTFSSSLLNPSWAPALLMTCATATTSSSALRIGIQSRVSVRYPVILSTSSLYRGSCFRKSNQITNFSCPQEIKKSNYQISYFL